MGCTVTLITDAWELAPYFFQNPLSSGKGHAKAFLNKNENMKNNFCMSRTNARYRSDRIAPFTGLIWQISHYLPDFIRQIRHYLTD